MGSDFLKKLKESVETGKPNEAIVAGFTEIVTKADKMATDPTIMKEIQDKAERGVEEAGKENAKKLTIEEVQKLNEIAKQEEERMINLEKKSFVTSAVITVNCEIEKLEARIVDYKKTITTLMDDSVNYDDKKKLIDSTIKIINDH